MSTNSNIKTNLDSTRLSTRKLVTMGMLSAIGIVLVALFEFPLIPAAPFLKYDPADIPILVGTLIYGPAAGLIMTVVVSFIQSFLLHGSGGIIGFIMHVAATGAMVIAAGCIYLYRGRTSAVAAIALASGAIAMTVTMIGMNLLLTPIFMGAPLETVIKMLIPAIIPFNLLKAGLNSAIAFIIYRHVEKLALPKVQFERMIQMSLRPTREQAWNLLCEYNSSEALRRHALMVEAVMRCFAREMGEDIEKWGAIGLLHDLDYEQYPELHCQKTAEILTERDVDSEYIRAIVSHGWGICSDVEPIHTMEKVLYATDELTGLIHAAAIMRPSKSILDLEPKSVKKKYKDKKFAAGVDRSVIEKGAEMLSTTPDDLIAKCILALREHADEIGLRGEL